MPTPFDPWKSMTVAADVALASRASGDDLARRTAARLDELLESAIHRSPLYRRRLQGRTRAPHLADMPVVRKADLMRSFDTWCCDPSLRLEALRRFVADPPSPHQVCGKFGPINTTSPASK